MKKNIAEIKKCSNFAASKTNRHRSFFDGAVVQFG